MGPGACRPTPHALVISFGAPPPLQADDDNIYDFSALELALMCQDCSLFDLLLSRLDDKAVVADAAAQQSPFLAMVRTVDTFPKTRKQELGDFALTSSNIMLSDVVVMGSRLWWHLLLSSTGSAGGKTCALVNWDMPMWWWVSEFASAQHAHIPTDADVTAVRAFCRCCVCARHDVC